MQATSLVPGALRPHHAVARRVRRRLGSELGQGTVEYVALILLVSLVMAGVVVGLKDFESGEGEGLAKLILGKLKEAVEKVQY